ALELLREMQPRTPALCVSGSADPTVIEGILEAGAFACINKDDLSTLCATVERALRRTNAESTAQTGPERSPITPPSSSPATAQPDSDAPPSSFPETKIDDQDETESL